MQTEPPATAEIPEAAGGEKPPQSETQPTPKEPAEKILTAEDVDESEDMEALGRMMTALGDVPFENTTKPKWKTGFPDEDHPGAQLTEAVAPVESAEALPGETTETTPTEETPTEEEQEQARAEAAAAKLPRKDANRVRISRFAEDDRLVIARMAEKDGLTIDAARAELIAEGKLKAESVKRESVNREAESESPPLSGSPFAADIATRTAEIAELETKMADAATAYDQKALTALGIEHNKALAALNKLELKAEREADAAQAAQQSAGAAQYAIAETSAKAKAVEQYPDAGVEGSELYEGIEDWIANPANADLLSRPNWPILAAATVAADQGIRPQAPPAAAPKVVPRRPSRAVPGPASGATAGAAPKGAPNYDQEIEEAGEDVVKLSAIMNRMSGRAA